MNLRQTALVLRNGIVKNLPTILTVLGVAGVGGTAILTHKAALKADREIDRQMYTGDLPKQYTKKEAIKAVWKIYIPSVIMGSATVACIVGANSVSNKRNIALAGAYGLASEALKEYRGAVAETLGANKEQKIRDKEMENRVLANPAEKGTIYRTGLGDTLCYEPLCGTYFTHDVDRVKRAFIELNDRWQRGSFGDFLSLNDLYYELSLEETRLGNHLGWNIEDGILTPRYTSVLNQHQQPCLCIDLDLPKRTV